MRVRWRLRDLLAQLDDWVVTTPSGVWRLLSRLKISYKRGQDYVHSPDPDYAAKLADIQQVLARTRACHARLVAVYLDEFTYYRQPTCAPEYGARGEAQPHALRSYRANTPTRVVASLADHDGRVLAKQGGKIGVAQLVAFYEQLRRGYPDAEEIFVILDNWPVHFHPDLLVALAPQRQRWQPKLSPSWPTAPSAAARRKWGHLQLPIQLLSLPTYASWENPIEKLWRWGRQEVLHMHGLADELPELRQQFLDFLGRFASGSPELLRYVGLGVPL